MGYVCEIVDLSVVQLLFLAVCELGHVPSLVPLSLAFQNHYRSDCQAGEDNEIYCECKRAQEKVRQYLHGYALGRLRIIVADHAYLEGISSGT